MYTKILSHLQPPCESFKTFHFTTKILLRLCLIWQKISFAKSTSRAVAIAEGNFLPLLKENDAPDSSRKRNREEVEEEEDDDMDLEDKPATKKVDSGAEKPSSVLIARNLPADVTEEMINKLYVNSVTRIDFQIIQDSRLFGAYRAKLILHLLNTIVKHALPLQRMCWTGSILLQNEKWLYNTLQNRILFCFIWRFILAFC